MSINISGLDKFQKELADLAKVLDEIDGEIINVRFDPDDPESIQAAINKMSKAIDDKVGYYKNNSTATEMIEEVKENLREQLLQKAAELRLEDNE